MYCQAQSSPSLALLSLFPSDHPTIQPSVHREKYQGTIILHWNLSYKPIFHPKYEDDHKYEDNLKYEDNITYEDSLKYEDNLKYEDDLKYEDTHKLEDILKYEDNRSNPQT